jgi:hypothetical protein
MDGYDSAKCIKIPKHARWDVTRVSPGVCPGWHWQMKRNPFYDEESARCSAASYGIFLRSPRWRNSDIFPW